jgi:hypothetical protein
MKLKKGSAAAKAFMAKIRSKKGITKKVGAVSKIKKLSKAKEARLNYLQNREDNDNLTPLQNKEYNKLVLEYRKTDAYKNKQKSKRGNWSLADKKQLALELGEDFYNAADWKKLTGKTKTVKKISGWKKGNTRMIEKGEKPFKTKKTILVKRKITTKPKGSFKKFTTINGINKQNTMKPNIKFKVGNLPTYKDKDAAREIQLFADNDSQLYFQRMKPILINLSKKHKKGIYDVAKAAKLFRYFIDAAMQKYNKDFGSRGDSWSKLLSVADRNVLANDYAINTLFEFELGNYTEK